MVQTGNEVTAGMLWWPQGQIYVEGQQRWVEFTMLFKAAIAGARDGARHGYLPVMVHIDRGGDNGGSRWFYDHILEQGVDFDVIGLSYYPFWHGPLSALQANLNDLALRYDKDIVVVETAYPQRRGRGAVYWESGWIPGVGWKPEAGDAWDNMTLFDHEGKALSSSRCYERARA